MLGVLCALCGKRRARRACPALDKWICPVCCGTKRQVEIDCPSDCAYLAMSREHPPVAEARRQRRDLEELVGHLRDLNERQSRLFALLGSFASQYQPGELQAVTDEDVAEAASAVAATLETAGRGVIYEHHPSSMPAERLARALTHVLREAGQGAGSSFDRDAAVVLRRLEHAARGSEGRRGDRSLLDLLGRVLGGPGDAPEDQAEPDAAKRIIVP